MLSCARLHRERFNNQLRWVERRAGKRLKTGDEDGHVSRLLPKPTAYPKIRYLNVMPHLEQLSGYSQLTIPVSRFTSVLADTEVCVAPEPLLTYIEVIDQ